MKLTYIININLADKTARARQICSNAAAFYGLLGDRFRLVVPGGADQPYIRNYFVANIKKESSLLRKLLFLGRSCIDMLLGARNEIVYSRNLFVLYCASWFGRRIVWEMHDAIQGANRKLFQNLQDRLSVVVISAALKEYLIGEFKFDAQKIHVAHDGVFIEKYDALRNIDKASLRRQLSLPETQTIVMHTGSLYEGRGAELFKTVAEAFDDLLFVHVGGTERDVARWNEYYRGYSNVRIIPHQSNEVLIQYQMACDLLFLPMTKNNPIWWCTSPMKLFEFMATGRPILASNIGSVGEILNEDNAVLFQPDQRESIIKGVHLFLTNRLQTEQKGSVALQQVREKYTWQKRAEGICKFLSQNQTAEGVNL